MKLIHYVGTNCYESLLKVAGSRCMQMRLRKLTNKAKNIDAQARGGIQLFFNQRTTDANERTAVMAKRTCLQANAANTSTSATITPAATIKTAGTNIKAAGTNAKQLAHSSLQLHSFSDDEDANGKHLARKHRQTTTSGMQPPAPELRIRNDNADGEHSARRHRRTTTTGAQPPAPKSCTCDNNNNELPWVTEDSDKDNSLYDDDGKGEDTQDESGENDWGAEEEGIMVSYHKSSTANSLISIQAVLPSFRSASMASIRSHATTANDQNEDNDNAASNSSSNEDVYVRMQRDIAYERAVSTASVYIHTVLMTHLLILDSKARSTRTRSLHRGYLCYIQGG
jgi:hypothetical protein